MESSNNNGKLIASMILGAAIGGALGILFAPAKGSETRKGILDKKDELAGNLKEKFDDLIEVVKKKVDTLKEKASDFMGNGMASAEKF